jgi:hypothetical protein
MWNAASTSPPRATYSLVAAVVTLLALLVAASGGAAPKPPTDLTLTNATETSLSLSWAPARTHGDRTVTGYHVYLDGARQASGSSDDLASDTSFDFDSLRCGTTYELGVEAVYDGGGTSSVGSVMASTSPCPSPAPAPASDTSSQTTDTSSSKNDTSAATVPAPADQTDATEASAAEASVVAAPAATASGALTFAPDADARVDESQPSTTFGTRKVLRVDGGSDPDMQSYLRFDVSGLGGAVTSATLRVYATASTVDGPAVYPAPSTWSETGITWANRPPAAGGSAADVGPIAPDTWVDWDVTKLVAGAGTYTFVLAGSSTDGVSLSSREGGASPELIVSTDGTTPSSGPGPGPGTDTSPPTLPGNLALVSRSTSDITVSWSASKDDVGVVGYDLLLNGTKTGETTSLNAAFSGLACGQSYTVGVRAFDTAGNRSAVASLATGTLACQGSPPPGPSGSVNWFPGYYVLAHDSGGHQKILDDPLVASFTGVQFRYWWSDSELAPHDYSAGFAALDADLKAVAAKSKKLIVMLQYKKSDGTPAVPADLLKGPGPWCSGRYCGELAVGSSHLAMVWNPAVNARLKAWISAMAAHAASSPYASSLAGIVFNETSLGTTDTGILGEAGYDPYAYMKGLQDNLLAGTNAAPRLPVLYYHEGGFVSMDGQSVKAADVMGNWMLQHPHTGTGTPDLKPKSPKTTSHPCAVPSFQGRIPCNPDVQAGDYSTSATDSLDQSFRYAFDSAPSGLHASFLTFSYSVGSGPNAFTFADVSRYIATHPVPNTAVPPGW